MLQDFRDKTQGWFTRIVFGLVCIAFILWGAHSFLATSSSSSNEPLSVNGKPVDLNQVNQTYQRLLQERQVQEGANFKLTEKMQNNLKQLAVQRTLLSVALMQSAEKSGLYFSPQQVGHVISGISAFQSQGHFSPDKFTQTLASMGFSENGFFNDIRDAMLINQLRFGIVSSSFSLPNEVSQLVELTSEKRDIAFSIVPIQSFANKITISEDEIKNYYEQHQAQFTQAKIVTVDYLILSLSELAKKIVISDEDLHKAYQDNADHYAKSAHGQFNQVKAELQKNLSEQRATQTFADALDKLTNLTYTHPLSLQPAATELKLTIQTSPPLIFGKPTDGLFADEKLKSVAFSADVLSGNNSPVINIDEQHALVLHLAKLQPAALKPLSQVRDQILLLLKAEKINGLAEDVAQNLVTQVLQGKTLVQAAGSQQLTATEVSNVARFNSGNANAIILNQAFQLPRPGKLPSVGVFKLPSGNFAVIQILKINAASENPAMLSIQKRVNAEKIENAYAQLDYQLYVRGVLAKAKISMDQASKNS